MVGLSSYSRDGIQAHIFGGAAFPQPANVYVTLHTGDPGLDGTANPGTTTTRILTAWSAPSSGVVNATGTPVARWDIWDATEGLTHWNLWDTIGPTGGNSLMGFALTGTINAVNGDPVELDALSVTAT